MIPIQGNTKLLTIGEGLLTALIFGSTLVFVKMGLQDVGPLTLAGLRYVLAFVLLAPFLVRCGKSMRYPSWVWGRLILIGICFYVVGNGALFWGLQTISPTTGSLLLNLTPVLVLLAGVVWLKELPTRVQIVGILVGIGGSVLFFSSGSNAGEPLGIGIVAFGLLGISSLGILGRQLARDRQVDTLPLTAIPMAIGGSLFLPIAFAVEGMPKVSATGWGVVLLLAVVNTACGYLLYNHVLKTLAAFELSVILTLAPLVTAFWAWVLLDDTLGIIPMIGILVVIAGVVLVQWGTKNAAPPIVR